MNPDDTRKQDGGAIFDALTAFEGMPEREQQEDQERDYSGWDEAEPAMPDAGEKKPLTQAEREALIESVAGYLARDDGQDMTQELLDERREEARNKGW
ncbi:hypothetical protein [Deinococcus sp. AJ005]|uniref:hypothetical protein n=1 Tax=Deinococcus sp. AJ005 TaxID=2652443 RepID=UPI00125CBA56|nr:hypothetical protein [Deinococcus sp. AJ005]QFP78005.1 hypothetical protein DAAJ005_17330 [Deinococcus sp. AJ005]